ncbi:MAG TPA: hypothetical protein ENF81_05805 [Thermotogaceae bacterium]|nr:hypothetical protein [Thermotogaceae bacterium]
MNEWIALLVGFLLPPLFAWILALIKPASVATFLAKTLSKLTKDSKVRNKVENLIGVKLLEIGTAIVAETPDNQEVAKHITEIKANIEVLKKLMQK